MKMEACTGPTEGAIEDLIPTIINALSLKDTGKGIPGRNSSDNVARSCQQQQPYIPIGSLEAPSRFKSVESSRRRVRPKQQQPINIENIKNEYSVAAESRMEDFVPTIINALSFNDASEENRQRNSSDNPANRRRCQHQRHSDTTEITLLRKTAERGYRRRQHQHQSNHKEQSLATDEEDVNFLDVFPAILNVCSTNNDGKSMAYENFFESRSSSGGLFSLTKTSHSSGLANTIEKGNNDCTNSTIISSSVRNVFSMADEGKRSKSVQNKGTNEFLNDQISSSIGNVLTIEDGGTNKMRDDRVFGNGMIQVYPFMRKVFSMNDIDVDTVQNSRKETSVMEGGNASTALSSSLVEKKGSSAQRKNKATQKIFVTRAYEVKEHYLESIFYVSISAILGSVFRVYMARIFGLDCEYKHVNDFFIPLTSKICVTSDGRSAQTGGALFIDLPSNIFGSFLMGMITPPVDKKRARLPWLHRDHPLQRDEVFHASLGTGFCGCLTTFASWNTQMVVMLDGTYCELGSQVVTVLFGYLIGLMGATYGFELGRQCGLWMYNYRHRDDDEMSMRNKMGDIEGSCFGDFQTTSQNPTELPGEGVELVDDDNVTLQPVPSHLHKVPLFLVAVAVLVAFIIGNVVDGSEFYKSMILLWILSPVGSLLRWRLSNLNMKKRICTNSPDWIPWGTLFANLFATVISACMEGLKNRYFFGANPESKDQWIYAILFALTTGVAGSLSTVSTMVKESVLLSEDQPGKAQGHCYSMFTCVSGCLLGLLVYAVTIRMNSGIV